MSASVYRPGQRLRRQLAALCLFCLGGWGWSAEVLAHATLLRSEPASLTVLDALPSTVRLWFNEPVTPLVLRLAEPDGTVHALEQAQAGGPVLQVVLPEREAPGAYGLSWRVVSADGHPVGGVVVFSVGGGVEAGPDTQAGTTAPPRKLAIWLARWVFYVGVFLGMGALLYGAAGAAVPLIAQRLLAVGLLGLLGGIGLQGLDALDLSGSALLSGEAWRVGWRSPYGQSALLALLAGGLGLGAWRIRPARWQTGIGVGAVLLLALALSRSGHASSAPPAWFSRSLVALHGAAVIAWLGVLLPLASASPTGRRKALQRFSRWAPGLIGVLLVSGALLIWRQQAWTAGAWQTDYGRVLLAKLALVALMLLIGAYNRYRLTRPVLREDGGAAPFARRLRRTAAAELVIGLLILALVAAWRFTPPPRALIGDAALPMRVVAQAGGKTASLVFLTAPDGQSMNLTIQLANQRGGALAAQALDLRFQHAALDNEAIDYSAQQLAEGTWRVEGVRLPALGRWQVQIDALVSDFERVRFTLEFAPHDLPKRAEVGNREAVQR